MNVYEQAHPENWRRHWHSLFCILSLDCCVRFWEGMGLVLKPGDKPAVQRGARYAYLLYQGDDSHYYAANYGKAQEAIDGFINQVSRDAGRGTADAVLDWGLKVCLGEKEAQIEYQWWSKLIELKHKYPETSCKLALSRERVTVVLDKIQTKLLDHFSKLLEQLKKLGEVPQSEWDADVYRSFKSSTNDGDVQGELPRPLNGISLILTHVNLLDFWGELVAMLSEKEVAALFDWYKCQVRPLAASYPHLLQKPRLPEPTGQENN